MIRIVYRMGIYKENTKEESSAKAYIQGSIKGPTAKESVVFKKSCKVLCCS